MYKVEKIKRNVGENGFCTPETVKEKEYKTISGAINQAGKLLGDSDGCRGSFEEMSVNDSMISKSITTKDEEFMVRLSVA